MFFDHEMADAVAGALILSTIAVCWVVIAVRFVGLRAFSKMTAFDFVITVAIGSLVAGASQAVAWPAFVQATVAIATLLGVQYFIARVRRSSERFEKIALNSPVLLMRNGKIITAALESTQVAKDDLIAKLREANVLDLADVQAVVLETTGDISVLHGDLMREELLDGVEQISR